MAKQMGFQKTVGRKGPLKRFELLSMERATSSLPVPDSPRMSTVKSWGATFSMVRVIARIGTDCPTIPSNCFSLSIVPIVFFRASRCLGELAELRTHSAMS